MFWISSDLVILQSGNLVIGTPTSFEIAKLPHLQNVSPSASNRHLGQKRQPRGGACNARPERRRDRRSCAASGRRIFGATGTADCRAARKARTQQESSRSIRGRVRPGLVYRAARWLGCHKGSG